VLIRTPSTMNNVCAELEPRNETVLREPAAPVVVTTMPGVCASAVCRSVTCELARVASGTTLTLLAVYFKSCGVRVADTTIESSNSTWSSEEAVFSWAAGAAASCACAAVASVATRADARRNRSAERDRDVEVMDCVSLIGLR